MDQSSSTETKLRNAARQRVSVAQLGGCDKGESGCRCVQFDVHAVHVPLHMGENMLGRPQREQLSHAPVHFGERRAQLVRREMAIERRQLPQTGEQTLFGSLPQTDKLTAAHNKYGAVFHSPRLFCGSERQHSRVFRGESPRRDAESGSRHSAVRRSADRRLHQAPSATG